MAAINNVFHISMLRKCLRSPEEEVPLHEIELQDDLTFATRPMAIVDRDFRATRGRRVHLVKVRWSEDEKDVTWELEDKIRRTHPELFIDFDSAVPVSARVQINYVTRIPFPV